MSPSVLAASWQLPFQHIKAFQSFLSIRPVYGLNGLLPLALDARSGKSGHCGPAIGPELELSKRQGNGRFVHYRTVEVIRRFCRKTPLTNQLLVEPDWITAGITPEPLSVIRQKIGAGVVPVGGKVIATLPVKGIIQNLASVRVKVAPAWPLKEAW
jgi:hypothetical protein